MQEYNESTYKMSLVEHKLGERNLPQPRLRTDCLWQLKFYVTSSDRTCQAVSTDGRTK